jgi:MSHA biogenesis protein MshP
VIVDARRGGFTLVGAIIILVVLAAAGAGMVKVGGVQRTTTSYAFLGARAYQAARSGIEWGVYKAVDSGACAASTSFSLSEGGLEGFNLDVTCTSTTHVESGDSTLVYHFTSTAERGTFGSRDFVHRELDATVALAGP